MKIGLFFHFANVFITSEFNRKSFQLAGHIKAKRRWPLSVVLSINGGDGIQNMIWHQGSAPPSQTFFITLIEPPSTLPLYITGSTSNSLVFFFSCIFSIDFLWPLTLLVAPELIWSRSSPSPRSGLSFCACCPPLFLYVRSMPGLWTSFLFLLYMLLKSWVPEGLTGLGGSLLGP